MSKKRDYIEKLSQQTSTTQPFYEAVGPDGKKHSFTPADLVKHHGHLVDSTGKKFKPKKIRGKSLSSKVMSSEFGKVKK
jgi:hypothetical protein